MQPEAMIAANWFRAFHQARARELTQNRDLDWDERTRAQIAEYKAASVYAGFIIRVE